MSVQQSRRTRSIHRSPKFQHPNDWNSSFWRFKMPHYDSISDKYCRSRPQTANRVVYHKLTHRLPIHSKNSSMTLAKSPKHSQDSKQLLLLKQKLVQQWDKYSVPYQHRELFYSHGKLTSLRLALEIQGVQKSLVVRVCNKIKQRQLILEEILILSNQTQSASEGKKLFDIYRPLTLQVFESIAAWGQYFKIRTLNFDWNGCDYIEKAKTDTDFLVDSKMAQTLPFNKNDPFLLNILDYRRYPKLLQRMLAAIKNLKLVSTYPRLSIITNRRESTRKSLFRFNYNQVLKQAQQPLMSEPEEKWAPNEEFITEFSGGFFATLVMLHSSIVADELANACYAEVLAAALSLHSSAILDKYLSEALGTLIPEVEHEARVQQRNQEYLFVRDVVFKQVTESLISQIIHEVFTEKCSFDILNLCIASVDLASIIQEGIDEELIQSHEIVYYVLNDLIDGFLDLD